MSRRSTTAKPKILFQLSGSIACFKACALISKFAQSGYDVEIACTANVKHFIGLATLEGLSGKPVFSDLYQPGRMLDHIRLAKWADLAILCPATGHTINRLASGLADDPVGAIFLAYDLKKPYLVAPAMNHEMIAHPSVRTSLETLREWGVRVLPTGFGHQACGDIAKGRLLDVQDIFEIAEKNLRNERKVLVPAEGVRA